jgi:hypothetical protein
MTSNPSPPILPPSPDLNKGQPPDLLPVLPEAADPEAPPWAAQTEYLARQRVPDVRERVLKTPLTRLETGVEKRDYASVYAGVKTDVVRYAREFLEKENIEQVKGAVNGIGVAMVLRKLYGAGVMREHGRWLADAHVISVVDMVRNRAADPAFLKRNARRIAMMMGDDVKNMRWAADVATFLAVYEVVSELTVE